MNDREKIEIRELALRKRVEALFGSGITDPKYIDMMLQNMKDVGKASMKLVAMNIGICLVNIDENIEKFRDLIISVPKLYGNENEWEKKMKLTGNKHPKKKGVYVSIETLAKSLNDNTDINTLEKQSIEFISEIISSCDGDIFNDKIIGMKIEEDFKKIATNPYSIIRK
ncbi:MAG: hypothetical protein PHQ95_04480 [Candidatus Gracilibacteria bacterium]|nr:hypothetical protein [Candidatus Gracilibacteria bacterium]